MSDTVQMPALGESVTEGTVTRWLKQVGDTVEVDEPLLEVSTDKVDTEIPSPVAGTLLEILVGEDETVEVGAALARIGSPDEAGGDQPAADGADQQAAQPAAEETPAPQVPEEVTEEPEAPAQEAPAEAPAQAEAPAAGGATEDVVMPALGESVTEGTVTRWLKQVGDTVEVDEPLLEVSTDKVDTEIPSPVAGTIVEIVVGEDDTAATEVSPLRGTTEKASRLRQIIASRMVEAMQSMAQLTTVVEVDVTRIARLRERAKADFKAREGVNLSYLPFFVLAATEALKAHPKINGVLEGDQITYHGHENIGIAVDTDRGLVVPVIRDAGDLNLAGIARKIADLAARTRANKVTPDELSGATFTVTNTGWGGALFDTPIVPVGTSAILGTGAIVKRPVVATDEDGSDYIAIRSMCYLALSYDHRLVDGADAARYLTTVKKRLEEGDFEAELGL